MQVYLDQFRQLTDSLAAVGECISDEDLILYMFRGVPPDYESLRQSIRSRPYSIPVTLDELNSLLITEEVHKQLLSSSSSFTDTTSQLPTILYTTQTNSEQQTKGRGKNNGYQGGRGGRNNRNQDRGSSTLSYPKVYCQICGKPNHTVVSCWHRLDTDSYSEPPPLPKQVHVTQLTAAAPSPTYWYLDSVSNTHVTYDPPKSQAVSTHR